MAKRAYRKAGRQTGLWVMCILLGVAGQVLMVPLLAHWPGSGPGAWRFLLMVIPLIVMIVVAGVLSGRLQRQRRQKIMVLLPAKGFRCVLGPTPEQRESFLAPLRHLEAGLDLRNSPTGLEWMAELDVPGEKVLLFELEFVTGSGKTSQLHVRTVVAAPTDIAEIVRRPAFVASRLPWLERRAMRKLEMREGALAAIAKKWSLLGDAATGARFFTPAVREELAHSPKGESWCIGAGWLCCVFRDYLDAENLAVFLERSQRVMKMAAATG